MPQRQTLTFPSTARQAIVQLVDGELSMSARLRQPYRTLAWRMERIAPLILTGAITIVALGGFLAGL